MLYAVWKYTSNSGGGQLAIVDQIVANEDGFIQVAGDGVVVGQGFTGNGSLITEAKFKLSIFDWVIGGSVHAAIFAHDNGTWGSNGKPKGQPLAVSSSVGYDAIVSKNGVSEWVVFLFSGGNRFQTAKGQRYFICLVGDHISNYGSGGHVAVCVTTDSLAFNGGMVVEGVFNGSEYASWVLYAGGSRVLFELFGEFYNTSFTVTYNGNGATGGSVPVDSSVYGQGALVTVVGNLGGLVRPGYVFMGWSTSLSPYSPFKFSDETGLVVPSVFPMSISNVTLYAIWVILRTVTYDGSGATGGDVPVDQCSPYPDGSTVTVLGQNTLVKLNRTFICWAFPSFAELVGVGDTFVITEDTVLYAGWIQGEPPTGLQYTVTYNKNGGNELSGSVPVDYNVYPSGATVAVIGNTGNLMRSGYSFLGWSTNSMATKASYTAGKLFNMPPNSVTLYAVWSYTGGGSGSGNVVNVSNVINVAVDELYAGTSGSKGTTINYTGTGNEAILNIASNMPSNIDHSAIIENLIIDGNNKNGTTGILLENVCNSLIRNLTIKNCDVGIRVKLSGNNAVSFGNRFEHIQMENVKTGILFEGTAATKNYSRTIIDDVGIKLKNDSNSNTGIIIEPTAKLYSAFVKANVWLNGSNGSGLKVSGQLKLCIVNLAVVETLQNNGQGILLTSGAILSDNQSFLLSIKGVQNSITTNGVSYSGVNVVSQ